MANISLAEPDQLLSQFVQFLEVVARVCNFVRLKAKPSHSIEDCREVDFLLGLGIGIIVPGTENISTSIWLGVQFQSTNLK